MTALRTLSDVIVDCFIAAAALYAVYRAIRHIKTIMDDQSPTIAHDPANTAIWDVLAEARRITEEGDHHAAG